MWEIPYIEEPACPLGWCCTTCRGTGWSGMDPCSDCYSTGHTHPIPEQGA